MSDIFTVVLPDIGEGVVEGEVIEWLKSEGDSLEQDEPVVLVMTDKATVELPAPYPGKLSKQHFSAGQVAIKDKPLYDIAVAKGVTLVTKKEKKAEAPKREKQQVEMPAPGVAVNGSGGLAAPATRKLARELGVAIGQLNGSGPDGIVTKSDVIGARGGVAAPTTPITRFPDDEIQPVQGLRALIADRMSESRRVIPDFSYFAQMDATRLVQMRGRSKRQAAEENLKLTYMPFFIRALSMALQEHPQFNASFDGERREIVLHKQHNIGIAVKTPLGLIVPVLKGVQEMGLHEVIRAYDDLVKRAQNHGLDPSEMKDGTITISNFGTVGGVWATPIINYPEVCILGVGRIEKRPVVVRDELTIRDMLNLSWSGDHRVIDGDMCASFSNHFVSLLENPSRIL